jgi:hypothetical protein
LCAGEAPAGKPPQLRLEGDLQDVEVIVNGVGVELAVFHWGHPSVRNHAPRPDPSRQGSATLLSPVSPGLFGLAGFDFSPCVLLHPVRILFDVTGS